MPTPKAYDGAQLILVGERDPKDKNYEHSEYLLAPPGTIVAPRPKGEAATEENAIRAIMDTVSKLEAPMSKGPAGYRKYMASGKKKRVARGPKNFMRKAQVGAVTNDPVAQALQAIAAVQNQYGLSGEQSANWLNTGQAPSGTSVGVAEGSGQFGSLLQTLMGAAGITGPDNNLAQLAVMQALGVIDPRALGVTDPSKFRSLLAEGKGFPTLEAQKMRFNESLYGFSQSSPNRGNVAQTGVI